MLRVWVTLYLPTCALVWILTYFGDCYRGDLIWGLEDDKKNMIQTTNHWAEDRALGKSENESQVTKVAYGLLRKAERRILWSLFNTETILMVQQNLI